MDMFVSLLTIPGGRNQGRLLNDSLLLLFANEDNSSMREKLSIPSEMRVVYNMREEKVKKLFRRKWDKSAAVERELG